MDVNAFLHAMPEVAQEEIVRRGINAVAIGDGINRMQIAGHNQGLAYYFDMAKVYNPVESDKCGYEVFDFIETCYQIIDRKNVATMPIRIHHCDNRSPTMLAVPKDLLAFNRDGECIGGKFRDSYLRWKEGKSAPGFALRKWDVLSDSMIATLEAEGIYTVEQFAAYPRERFAARFPQEFIDAHTRAGQWVAGKEIRAKAAESAAELDKLRAENRDLAQRLSKLEAATASKVKRPKNKLLEGLE